MADRQAQILAIFSFVARSKPLMSQRVVGVEREELPAICLAKQGRYSMHGA